jgi:hypothetical protein
MMTCFNFTDFKYFDRTPTSPQALNWNISNLMYSSVSCRAKVENCNTETGEYRIVLTGTLDLDPNFWNTIY